MTHLLALAFRNLIRQKQRYVVIFSVLVLGFTVMVMFIGTVLGMNRSLQTKAARYFAGEVSVAAYANGSSMIVDQATVLEELRSAGVPYGNLCRRTNYDQLDGSVYFNGSQVRQRRLVGIDWSLEKRGFSSMEFVSGGIEGMGKGTGILVSSAMSAKTGVRVGDDCVVLLTTKGGSRNTVNLIVSGVYRESSFFGATAYLDIETLNAAWGLDPGSATDMGMILQPDVSQSWAAERIQARLSKKLLTGPVVNSRDEQTLAIGNAGANRTYIVMTIDARLSGINQITQAFFLVTWFLLGMFLFITMIGISNTYRMIVRERMREIGTLRAIGMQRWQLQAMIVLEAVLLATLGGICGLLLALGGLQILKLSDFSSMALVAMFLENGHLSWHLVPLWVGLAFSVLLGATVLGAWGPARVGARLSPIKALGMGNI